MRWLDIDTTGLSVMLCGNYGDPIYHPEFFDLVRSLKHRACIIKIVTNGSYRTETWWQNLCQLLDSCDIVEFSVDGIPENFTQYRVNADWPSIRIGMETCAKSKVMTQWKYIPFSFNEHTIDLARDLANQIGIDKFYINESYRFDPQQELIPNQINFVNKKYFEQSNAIKNQNLTVDPLCHYGHQHFVSAAGYYSACCMISTHQWYYKSEFGKNQERYSIKTTTLSQILSQPQVLDFYDQIPKNPILACQYQCPKTD